MCLISIKKSGFFKESEVLLVIRMIGVRTRSPLGSSIVFSAIIIILCKRMLSVRFEEAFRVREDKGKLSRAEEFR